MVSDMGIWAAPSQSTISCSSRRTSEQAPRQRTSSGSMPLVASNGGAKRGLCAELGNSTPPGRLRNVVP